MTDCPIGKAMQVRIKAGGLTSVLKEMEAKKQGAKIYKDLKLAAKGKPFEDLVGESGGAAADGKLAVSSSKEGHLRKPSYAKTGASVASG